MKVFRCTECGECCYGEGGILVADGEASRISGFLGIGEREFLFRFCETRNRKTYIRCNSEHWCVFFDRTSKCLIHPVKPARCVQWPFFPEVVGSPHALEMAKEGCPGISRTCSHREFVKAAGKYSG